MGTNTFVLAGSIHPARTGSLIHDTSPNPNPPPTQRPVIAAGIRGLIVAGGKYTGPAMNPMIAFGWAVHTGAYKVRIRTDGRALLTSSVLCCWHLNEAAGSNRWAMGEKFKTQRLASVTPTCKPLLFDHHNHAHTQNFDHYLVYWIAPTVGAVLATVLFAVFSASFLSDDAEKAKAD